MRYAYVIDGVVDHLSDTPPMIRVDNVPVPDPDPHWFGCPDTVFAGFLYVDGEWFAPPPVEGETITPEENGQALAERQRKAAKEEAKALAASGKTNEALQKLLEII